MSTRAKITVIDRFGEELAIYRHSDGYPQGVISDIKTFMENYHDPFADQHGAHYWLANFIFYAKLTAFLKYKDPGFRKMRPWEYSYGVRNKDFEQADLEYWYILDLSGNMAKIEIREYDWTGKKWKTIFKGTLKKAVEKYADGEYHIHSDVMREAVA